MKLVASIPARYDSTRFPGKPLALIQGKPMILWVAQAVKDSNFFHQVLVATDDSRIEKALNGIDVRVVMTSKDHPSGTDRVRESISSLGLGPQDVVVNVQGDEPLVKKEWLQALVTPFEKDPELAMTTLGHPLNLEELESANSVKVLIDNNHRALYFSRFPIPFSREKATEEQLKAAQGRLLKHMGFYGYRVGALEKFCGAPQSIAERAESLEQLRALDLGMPIHVSLVQDRSLGVDTPQDLEKIEQLLRLQLKDHRQ